MIRVPFGLNPLGTHIADDCLSARLTSRNPPSAPLRLPMAQPEQERFKALAKEKNVPEPIIEWLAKNGAGTIKDLAIAAATEESVHKEIIDVLTAKSLEVDFAAKIAVKKLWVACRAYYDNDMKPSQEHAELKEAPIPPESEKDIRLRWWERHTFVLTDKLILIETTQGAMWRETCNIFWAGPSRIVFFGLFWR